MKKRVSFLALLFLFTNMFVNAKTTLTRTVRTDNTHTIFLHISLQPKDFILKDSIDISIDQPNITLSEWKADKKAVEKYDETFQETKKLFQGSFSISLDITSKKPLEELKDAHIYLSYYQGSKKRTVQELLPLQTKAEKKMQPIITGPEDKIEEITPQIKSLDQLPTKEEDLSFSAKLSNLIATTESMWIRILLVLLLGLLMSLTPCIYPMVPITIGILQSHGSKSVAYNFLQALCYTMGIATTFAVLGLTAALTGQLFGSLMGNPFVIVGLAVFLAYLGLAMFGFYEMYTPKFLNKGTDTSKVKQSLLSIFLFGAISGTVASPCLSPGLILLLSIVTAMGSKLLGFALLFSFGIGLSIPLLIIGTFSSSLNVLPRAGMWMVEVKKLFGFMLFGMAFYFLNTIVPAAILFGIMTLFMLTAGIFYFYSISKNDSPFLRALKNIVAVICTVAAVFLAFKTYQATFFSAQKQDESFWYTQHATAMEVAKQEKKKLFIDVGAQFCSICKAIDRGLLSDSKVRAAMNKFVNLKIDGSDCPEDLFGGLCKKYEIIGFPTYLLIDAQTGDLIARWGSELYDLSAQKFINILQKY